MKREAARLPAESEDGVEDAEGLKTGKIESDSPGGRRLNGLGKWSVPARQH